MEFAYLGRSDSQIKLRGNRIEPGEIDAAFTSHPQVNHAATVAQTLDSGDAVLVTYVSATGSCRPTRATHAFAAEFLPRHLLPSAVVVLDSLPLTPTGKLDQKSLPTTADHRHSAYREPTTAVERSLTAIFSEVLGVEDPVGIYDDFFALGGTSLSAVRVVAAVQEQPMPGSPASRASDPTPAGIAAALVTGPSADAELDVVFPYARRRASPVFFVHPDHRTVLVLRRIDPLPRGPAAVRPADARHPRIGGSPVVAARARRALPARDPSRRAGRPVPPGRMVTRGRDRPRDRGATAP